METRQDNRRSDVIRCEYCGEDYSVTYRHCPFCDDRASYGSDRAPARGGKRVATNKRGGGYGGGMQPVQIIGLVLSVILIIAAVYIVFTVLSPLFGGGAPADESSVSMSQSEVSSSVPNVSTSEPGVSTSAPDVSTSGDISTPVIPDISGDPSVVTPVVAATGITLSVKDVTLKADETLAIKATLTPADCTDTVVWSVDKPEALTVAQDGTATNVNKGTGQVTVAVTARVGELKAVCLVRCKGGSTGAGTTTGTQTGTNPGTQTGTDPGTTTTPVAAGTTGTVTGTTTGLLIRSGPGRNYEMQDTALNGAQVTILEQTADGWYKISYSGKGGVTKTGYVSKDYIKVN